MIKLKNFLTSFRESFPCGDTNMEKYNKIALFKYFASLGMVIITGIVIILAVIPYFLISIFHDIMMIYYFTHDKKEYKDKSERVKKQ